MPYITRVPDPGTTTQNRKTRGSKRAPQCLETAPLTPGTGSNRRETGMDTKFGLMGVAMKVSGKKTRPMERGSLCMLTATFTMGNGSMIRRMDEACTLILMERTMKVIGMTTNKRETEVSRGPMELDTRASTQTARSMEEAN